MKKNYTEQQKFDILKRCQNGESILLISKETNISRSTVYRWLSASLKKKLQDKKQKNQLTKTFVSWNIEYNILKGCLK